jgi:hypothetical protein
VVLGWDKMAHQAQEKAQKPGLLDVLADLLEVAGEE